MKSKLQFARILPNLDLRPARILRRLRTHGEIWLPNSPGNTMYLMMYDTCGCPVSDSNLFACTSGNGTIDTKIFYEAGLPVRAERDMKGRSTVATWQPDRWEYYDGGRTVRVGTDINGDGKVDRWDRDEERLRNSALAVDNAAKQ